MSEAKSLLCSQDSIPPVSPSTSPFSVSIGTGNIIHPLCKFEPQNGPIMIGNNNIFEEHVVVTNRNSNEEPLVIGDGNVIEVGASACLLDLCRPKTLQHTYATYLVNS